LGLSLLELELDFDFGCFLGFGVGGRLFFSLGDFFGVDEPFLWSDFSGFFDLSFGVSTDPFTCFLESFFVIGLVDGLDSAL